MLTTPHHDPRGADPFPDTSEHALALKAAHPRPCRSPAGPTSWLGSTRPRHRSDARSPPGARAPRVGSGERPAAHGGVVSYTRIIDELADRLPSLAMASRRSALPDPPSPDGRRRISAPRRPPATGCRRSTCRRRGRLASWAASAVAIDEFIAGPADRAREDELISAFCCRPRRAPSGSPRSARATRWSSRSARWRWRSGPSAGRCACVSGRRADAAARARGRALGRPAWTGTASGRPTTP